MTDDTDQSLSRLLNQESEVFRAINLEFSSTDRLHSSTVHRRRATAHSVKLHDWGRHKTFEFMTDLHPSILPNSVTAQHFVTRPHVYSTNNTAKQYPHPISASNFEYCVQLQMYTPVVVLRRRYTRECRSICVMLITTNSFWNHLVNAQSAAQ